MIADSIPHDAIAFNKNDDLLWKSTAIDYVSDVDTKVFIRETENGFTAIRKMNKLHWDDWDPDYTEIEVGFAPPHNQVGCHLFLHHTGRWGISAKTLGLALYP